GCKRVIVPEVGSTLSAAGELISDLATERRATRRMSTAAFDRTGANAVLDGLESECDAFVKTQGAAVAGATFVRTVEARYADQAWEIEVGLPVRRFVDEADIAAFRAAFDAEHQRLFGFCDPASAVEIVSWRVSVSCRMESA